MYFRSDSKSTKEYLNYYKTSVPMSYYAHHKRTPQKFLIIENKDTFYSMRKYLIEGNQRILGLEVGTLIYGGGKGICQSFWDFVYQVEPYFVDKGNQVYYFGDLDFEGLAIYLTLSQMYQEEVSIFLFTRAYQRMLEKAEKIGEIEELPKMKEGQKDLGGYYMVFGRIFRERTGADNTDIKGTLLYSTGDIKYRRLFARMILVSERNVTFPKRFLSNAKNCVILCDKIERKN